jgi:Zn finger protein HypA/HybF involved in hydrogenase expression
VAESLEEVQWSFNKYWRPYFEETFTTVKWHWESYWHYVNNINKGRCLSFSTNDKFIHFIKCSNNLLPTIDNLRIRNEIYNNVKCPMCIREDETLPHNVICPGHEAGFKQVEEETTTKIQKFITKFTSSIKLRLGQLECIIFEYKDDAFPLFKEHNRLELTRGLISDTIMTKLQQYTSRKI